MILPGQSKNGEIPQPKKTVIQPPKRSGDIEMPVYHETTKPSQNSTTPSSANKVPQFRPKKFNQAKNVKWEPTSESEMSEIEGESSYKKRYSFPQPSDMSKMSVPSPNTRWDQASTSPMSISPSLPSMSPAFNNTLAGASGIRVCQIAFLPISAASCVRIHQRCDVCVCTNTCFIVFFVFFVISIDSNSSCSHCV